MGKIKETAKVISQECIAKDIYSMWIKTATAKEAKPGQFISIYTKNDSKLLPRPISICEINEEKTALKIVYRTVGAGTKEFSGYDTGDEISVLGPLGNGFPVGEEKAILIGGGIGVPPILELSKALKEQSPIALLGYRDSTMFLKADFDKYVRTEIATEDGSVGTKGNVMDALAKGNIPCDIIYACGPMPMLRAIRKYAQEKNIPAYISLEERMACGVGACLGCVCKTTKKDAHSHVNNARVCTEGPVFEAGEVDI